MGLIAFRKDFLETIVEMPVSRIEKYEFIEQMRIIENGYTMTSVPVYPSLPSVNEPEEAGEVNRYIEGNAEQKALLQTILKLG